MKREQLEALLAGVESGRVDLAAMAGGSADGGSNGSSVELKGDPTAKDAALIAAAQRVEHYEIAACGTARTLAGELDLDEAKRLLDETLDEERNADELLTKLATGGMLGSGINAEAVR